MATITKSAELIIVELGDSDFSADWKPFLTDLKKLDGWEYDGEDKIWILPEKHYKAVALLKRKYLMRDDPNQTNLFGESCEI